MTTIITKRTHDFIVSPNFWNQSYTIEDLWRMFSLLQIAPAETPDSKMRMVIVTGPPEAQFKVNTNKTLPPD